MVRRMETQISLEDLELDEDGEPLQTTSNAEDKHVGQWAAEKKGQCLGKLVALPAKTILSLRAHNKLDIKQGIDSHSNRDRGRGLTRKGNTASMNSLGVVNNVVMNNKSHTPRLTDRCHIQGIISINQ